jgi:hypothetical protein
VVLDTRDYKNEPEWIGMEGKGSYSLALLHPLTPLDPSLTLTRTQHPAIVGNAGNRKPFVYAGYANPCNAQQLLTAHS